MSVAYFQSPSLNLAQSIVDSGSHLIKRCIIAIEGEHFCSQKRKYVMPAEMIVRLGDNLNVEIGNGREIPLFQNHNLSEKTKFGNLEGYVDCRPVTEADLPNPSARKMLGKLALFGVAKIFKNLDEVRSGAIKALSPGIDMGRELIFEVSAVPIASMPGVALFSFSEVMAERSKVAELRDEAMGAVDGLIESIRQLERADAEMTSSISAKQQSFSQFIEYMADLFQIPAAEGGVEYDKNPYARETIKSNFGYDLTPKETEVVLDEVAAIVAEDPVKVILRDDEDPVPLKKPLSRSRRNGSRRSGSFDLATQGSS